MSVIVKPTGWRALSDVVRTDDGNHYMVSSTDLCGYGFETMVFKWNLKKDDVDDWMEEYCERYESEKEMENRHKEICKHLEECLAE